MQPRSSLEDDLSSVVRTSGDRLLRVAYQLTHDRVAAEDIVQDALYQVYRSLRRRSQTPEHLEAYLRRAILNEFLKRARHRTERVVAELGELAEPGSFDHALVEQDAMWQALGSLSVRQRAVLVLRFYERLPDVEIAELLSCRQATVRSLAARGLAALRDELKPQVQKENQP